MILERSIAGAPGWDASAEKVPCGASVIISACAAESSYVMVFNSSRFTSTSEYVNEKKPAKSLIALPMVASAPVEESGGGGCWPSVGLKNSSSTYRWT